MRTTLTLEDDLAKALKERARRSGRSFKAVVNDALRRGLAVGEGPDATPAPFRVEAAPRGFRPGVDPRRLNQLLDDLEVGARGRGLARSTEGPDAGASKVHEAADEPDGPQR